MREAEVLKDLKSLLEAMGPDWFDDFPALRSKLPKEWLARTRGEALIYMRGRLDLTQAELAAKAGVTQRQVSLMEGGRDVRLTTWTKVYSAMGFDLVLVPVTTLTFEQLQDRARQGRPRGHRGERSRRRFRAIP